MIAKKISDSLQYLGEFLRGCPEPGSIAWVENEDYKGLLEAMGRSEAENAWFTQDSMLYALKAWGELLTGENLTEWLKPYSLETALEESRGTLGVVMAGNIPLVGFHDMICSLVSGWRFLGKLSSQDRFLLPYLTKRLIACEPGWEGKIVFTEGRLEGFDRVIATGSNNTSRYFEYYFGKYPHIIRKNRNSLAILSGNESRAELEGLADDIFLYFGLGCRSVSKLYLPEGYDPRLLDMPFRGHAGRFHHHKYRNNYDYNKSIYLVNRSPFIEGSFYLLVENPDPVSPVSVIHYEFYQDYNFLLDSLALQAERLQCIVSGDRTAMGHVRFGESQKPGLADYSDGVDTLRFLLQNN